MSSDPGMPSAPIEPAGFQIRFQPPHCLVDRITAEADLHVMRFVCFVLFAAALFILGACVAPAPSSDKKAVNRSDLDRFIEPTNGSAYSQGSSYYYLPPGLGR